MKFLIVCGILIGIGVLVRRIRKTGKEYDKVKKSMEETKRRLKYGTRRNL